MTEVHNPTVKTACGYRIAPHAVRHLISHHLPRRLLGCVILFPYLRSLHQHTGSGPIFCQARCLFAFQPCRVPPSNLSSATAHQGTCLLAGGGRVQGRAFLPLSQRPSSKTSTLGAHGCISHGLAGDFPPLRPHCHLFTGKTMGSSGQ